MLGLPSPAVLAGGSLRGGNAVAGLSLWQGGSRRGSTGGLSVLDVLREAASELGPGKEEQKRKDGEGKEAAGNEGRGDGKKGGDDLRVIYQGADVGRAETEEDDAERGPGRRRKGKPVLDS